MKHVLYVLVGAVTLAVLALAGMALGKLWSLYQNHYFFEVNRVLFAIFTLGTCWLIGWMVLDAMRSAPFADVNTPNEQNTNEQGSDAQRF